ncbi:glycosyl transferase family 39 [Beutenbergia cavernae DSM 12333]|uniref:Polyprenol-phosphate-mannose--protein mannosyltransferase n=1 Tax=Beutenbergia cavernae (strain ATCC BAA-8 / DSM 12333 / CCUG 43141 / JCM 11478 / NBRC 16432 / NCIMB 13614 / HKI 0122) TaxID=471853 RepID=C5C025_BEUC1|nr:phospholipid carrier-dependent glycosyltransferase [Beutenbergia cavernae]ACQ79211.1 glycosyl transferase family 39 [Beutenbergia cavernae DSM 12333]
MTQPDAEPTLPRWAGLPGAPATPADDALPRGERVRRIEQRLLARLVTAVPGSRAWGWIGPLAVTAIAAVLRIVGLDRPARLIFDETYYVKQAYSLLALGFEGRWDEDVDEAFAAGDTSGLLTDADYVVHPPLGKWLIAIGIRLLGQESVVGWRIAGAVLGALSVLLVARIGRRLFASTLLGTTAGLLLAVDGMHLVLSRTGILDIFVSFFVLAAFGTLLLDREQSRRRLAARAAPQLADGGLADPWGPRIGMRWWLLATGVLLGLACGVKWSGIYAVAVFGIAAVVWSTTARRAIGVRLWFGGGFLRDGVPSFLTLVPVAVAAYVASWASWFVSNDSYYRHWARDVNAVADEPVRTWLPDTLNSWWQYHLTMWDFHTNLSSEHTYSSHPIGWLLQLRPTSFAWQDVAAPPGHTERWIEAVLAVGNPIVWWGGAIALVAVLWMAIVRRDWRAWAICVGYAAMYLPWFTYSAPFADRTIFTFYAVAFAPYVALALTYGLGLLLGPRGAPRGLRTTGARFGVVVVALALLVAAFFWPIWTGQPVPYWYWKAHMWIGNLTEWRIGWI